MSINADSPNPHFAVRPEWLALHHEPVIEPELPIVDAHHHLWDRAETRYLFFDFIEDLNSGHKMEATVFVECGAMYRKEGPQEERPLGETEFANCAAAMSQRSTGWKALNVKRISTEQSNLRCSNAARSRRQPQRPGRQPGEQST